MYKHLIQLRTVHYCSFNVNNHLNAPPLPVVVTMVLITSEYSYILMDALSKAGQERVHFIAHVEKRFGQWFFGPGSRIIFAPFILQTKDSFVMHINSCCSSSNHERLSQLLLHIINLRKLMCESHIF